MKPEVTVLMPNYNNAPFLDEAIKSIIGQSFKDFIFLIVDDGSTDESIQIIRKFTDPRIRLIEKEKNSGIVDALNIGLAQVDTKYIVRMDGDDISTPDRIKTLYDFMEKNEHIGVCGSQMKIFGTENAVTSYHTDPGMIKARLIFNNGVSHPASIFRSSILKKNNLFYRNIFPYMEDYDLFFRMKDHTEFANIDAVLFHYRLLSHNSTVKHKDSVMERYRNIYGKLILPSLNIEPTESNLEKHLEFFIKPGLTFSMREYKRWTKLLISQNEKTKAFPQKALEELLKERWDVFFFKAVSMAFWKTIAYFAITKKVTWKKISYFLKFKINKLIGRNK
jgi:glycosyltransferase involved in cell wall biosynthesis